MIGNEANNNGQSSLVTRGPAPVQRGLLQCKAEVNNSESANRLDAPPIVQEVLRSSGQSLDEPTRAYMEPRFAHDFSGVRVHTNNRAAESAREISAQAYTVGSNVVFDTGRFAPNTSDGRRLLAHELTHVVQQRGSAGTIARQPSPADKGWSDAPAKGLNETVSTVDDKGQLVSGKAATKGVWRVPVEGLSLGLKSGDKGPAFETAGGRAVVLIPNTVKPSATGKDDPVPVDVLLHFHGFGIGYRELRPGQQDFAKVLKPGEIRDVALYQMEQQLLSLSSRRFVIAVLPQGTERSGFGNLSSNSDAYLKEVLGKLSPRYFPKEVVPGRVTVSGHSGGGPTATSIADSRTKAGKRTDLLLFDAINSSCTEKEPVLKDGQPVFDGSGKAVEKCKKDSPCKSNEFTAVTRWVKGRINADIASLSGVAPDKQVAELQKSGTQFHGVTSSSLKTSNSCSYGFWYNKLNIDIQTLIKKANVSEPVRSQLSQNYEVHEATGLTGMKGNEPHEKVLSQGNLEAVLKN